MMLKAGEGDEEAGTYVTDDRSTGSVSLSVPLNSARPKSGELQATAKGLPVWPLKPRTPVHHPPLPPRPLGPQLVSVCVEAVGGPCGSLVTV